MYFHILNVFLHQRFNTFIRGWEKPPSAWFGRLAAYIGVHTFFLFTSTYSIFQQKNGWPFPVLVLAWGVDAH
jgi:hypothetical protein